MLLFPLLCLRIGLSGRRTLLTVLNWRRRWNGAFGVRGMCLPMGVSTTFVGRVGVGWFPVWRLALMIIWCGFLTIGCRMTLGGGVVTFFRWVWRFGLVGVIGGMWWKVKR